MAEAEEGQSWYQETKPGGGGYVVKADRRRKQSNPSLVRTLVGLSLPGFSCRSNAPS